MREELRWRNGVRIKELKESDTLVVETLHHTYEITVLEPSKAEVLVSGGDLFPVPRPASVSCASVLSSFLKLDGIYVGLRMKIRMDGSYVVTSRVRRIGVIPSLAEALPVASSVVLSNLRALRTQGADATSGPFGTQHAFFDNSAKRTSGTTGAGYLKPPMKHFIYSGRAPGAG